MCFIEIWGGGGETPRLRKSNKVLVTKLPTMGQKCWKKRGGMPLGPGAFNGYICFRGLCTSLGINSLVSFKFISGNTLGCTASKILKNPRGLMM